MSFQEAGGGQQSLREAGSSPEPPPTGEALLPQPQLALRGSRL